MKFDLGTILVVVAVLIFYLRLILLQWGKSRRLRDLQTIQPKTKKGVVAAPRTPAADVMRFRFGNIYFVMLAIALMIGGAVMVGIPSIPVAVRSFWWLPTTIGIVLFGFMIH